MLNDKMFELLHEELTGTCWHQFKKDDDIPANFMYTCIKCGHALRRYIGHNAIHPARFKMQLPDYRNDWNAFMGLLVRVETEHERNCEGPCSKDHPFTRVSTNIPYALGQKKPLEFMLSIMCKVVTVVCPACKDHTDDMLPIICDNCSGTGRITIWKAGGGK